MAATAQLPPTARPRSPHALLGRLMCAPPDPVAEGVALLRGGAFRAMNVLLVDEPDGAGVVVFDTGEAGMAPGILAAARRRGGISRVVLGHGDTDHRGAAPAIARAGGAGDGPHGARGAIPIECHADAVPHAEGRGGRDYWRPELLPGAVRRFHGVMHHVWDGGPVRITGTVAAGDDVAGFEVIELPGPAPGLIGLWRARDRVALVSDAFYVTDMWGRPQDPAVPLPAYNHDTEQARESLRALAALEPRVVVPGHLGPLVGDDLRERLERAADALVG